MDGRDSITYSPLHALDHGVAKPLLIQSCLHYPTECRIAVLGPHDAEYMSELTRLPPEAKVGQTKQTQIPLLLTKDGEGELGGCYRISHMLEVATDGIDRPSYDVLICTYVTGGASGQDAGGL